MQNRVTALQRMVNILDEPLEPAEIADHIYLPALFANSGLKHEVNFKMHLHHITLKFEAAIVNSNSFYFQFYFIFHLLC